MKKYLFLLVLLLSFVVPKAYAGDNDIYLAFYDVSGKLHRLVSPTSVNGGIYTYKSVEFPGLYFGLDDFNFQEGDSPAAGNGIYHSDNEISDWVSIDVGNTYSVAFSECNSNSWVGSGKGWEITSNTYTVVLNTETKTFTITTGDGGGEDPTPDPDPEYSYKLHAGAQSYELTDNGTGVFTKSGIASLASGFYLSKTTTVGSDVTMEYYGRNGSNELVNGVEYTLPSASSSLPSASSVITFENSPWTSVTVSYNPTSGKLIVSGTETEPDPDPMVTYSYKLVQGDNEYSLTDADNDGVYTASITSLESGFYVGRVGSNNTETYYGKGASNLENGVAYSLATGTATPLNDAQLITIANAPWTSVTVSYNPVTDKLTVSGNETSTGGGEDPEPVPFAYNGNIYLTINWGSDGYTGILGEKKGGIYTWKEIEPYSNDNLSATFAFTNSTQNSYNYIYDLTSELYWFGPAANKTASTTEDNEVSIIERETQIINYFTCKAFKKTTHWTVPAGVYNITLNTNTSPWTMSIDLVSSIDFTPVLHFLTASQDNYDIASTNKMTFDGDFYTFHVDQLSKNFKIYDARNKKYLKLSEGLSDEDSKVGLAQDHDLTLVGEATSFDMHHDAYHKVNVFVSDDLSTLKLVSTHDTWTLVGAFNNWNSSDPNSEFSVVETTPTEGVKHKLTLPVLAGSFRIHKTGSDVDADEGTHYAKKGNTLGWGETIELDKYVDGQNVSTEDSGNQGSVEVPEKLFFSYLNFGTPSTKECEKHGNVFLFSDYMGNYGDSSFTEMYFYDENNIQYGPTQATTLNKDTSGDIGGFEVSDAKWTVQGFTGYDIVVDFENCSITVYGFRDSPYSQSSSARRRVIPVADGGIDTYAASGETDLRLTSGALENVTLELDTRSGALTLVNADPAYALVVVTNAGTDQEDAKYYRLVSTKVQDGSEECYVYQASVATIPAGAKVYVAADDGTEYTSYGADSENVKLTVDSQNLTAGTDDEPAEAFNVPTELSDVTFIVGRADGDKPVTLYYRLASGPVYRLVGYYGNWGVEYSYSFTKVGDGTYQLYIPELPISGDDKDAVGSAAPGFKIAEVDGDTVVYYGASAPLGDENATGIDQTINLEADGDAIIPMGLKANQWFDACLLEMKVTSAPSAAKGRGAAGTVKPSSLKVKSSIATAIDALEADAEPADVYTLTGICLVRDARMADLRKLAKGIYLYKGQKLIVR